MARAGLEPVEREEISRCLAEDEQMTWTEIGRRVDRHRSTVQREVDRHGGRHRYRAQHADRTAIKNRRRQRPCLLESDTAQRAVVTERLRAGFSPAGIAAMADVGVCTETIYTTLYQGHLDVKARDCLRSRRPRRRRRNTDHSEAKHHPLGQFCTIHQRPTAATAGTEPGHWEGDLVIGARNASAVITLIERVSRYTRIVEMPNGYRADDTLAGLIEAFDEIPVSMRRSLTWDRGSEMTRWTDLALHLDLDVWFCDPHSPWQRGLNEHNNRLIRYWLPRGINLATTEALDRIRQAEHVLNHQPRRSLNWDTPYLLGRSCAMLGADRSTRRVGLKSPVTFDGLGGVVARRGRVWLTSDRNMHRWG